MTSNKFIALSLFTVMALQGCDQSANLEKAFVSGIVLENVDSTTNPGDDFYQFVNGKWLDGTEIPADKSSYGIGFILHERSEEIVRGIIEQSASGEFEKGSNEQMVGDLYTAFMDLDNRNSLGIKPLQEELEVIDQIANYDDFARQFGLAIRYYDVPFSFGVYPDFEDPTKYAIYFSQSGLGLPDKEYYSKTDDRSVELREKYKAHIAKMFTMAGIEGGEGAAERILQLEMRMAAENMDKEDTRDARKLYNPFSTKDLADVMPNFAWGSFLEGAGLTSVDTIVISMTDYSKSLDEIIANTPLEVWKEYLKWNFIHYAAPYLSEEIDNENFDFYGKALFGRQEQRPLWTRGVRVVNQNLGEVVGQVYVKDNFPPEAKDRMSELVENLLKAYEASIGELDWMSDSTKVEALDKLKKFIPKIGYPDIWKEYQGLDVSADDPLGNKIRADLMEYDRIIGKLGGPIQKHEWYMTPQTVNAYYNPTQNEIVFPAAILQVPLFNLNADDAANYGAIGAIIGHEIGHGFDDSGSRFDGDGQLRDWWTAGDRERFEELTSRLVAQYDQYQVFNDLNVNGTFTLGENIGDLGGLAISLKAYQMSLEGKEPPVMDGLTGIQRVFLGYAQSWLNKSREEAMRVRINSDPHSPPRFRVNGVVRNIPEFYEAFDIKETSALYLPPEERVKIW